MIDFNEIFEQNTLSPSGVSWKIAASNKKPGDFAGYFDKDKKDFIITYKGKEYSASVILDGIGKGVENKKLARSGTLNLPKKDNPILKIQPKEFKEGEIVEGVVTRAEDYGLFVKVNGRVGLLHRSEMIFCKKKRPSELFSEGQEILVKVLKFEKESDRVSFTLKGTEIDPWLTVSDRYNVGDSVCGEVVGVVSYGLFVEIEPGVRGLLHRSLLLNLQNNHKLQNYFAVGDSVTVSIAGIEQDKRNVRFSSTTLAIKENTVLTQITASTHEDKSLSVFQKLWNSFKELVS